jgi:putative CocE/NonD family hydrolase
VIDGRPHRGRAFRRIAILLVTMLVVVAGAPGVGSSAPPRGRPATYGMELREAMIPMPDGVRLAADLYVPTGGDPGERFPVLLEYLPYRKDESRARNWAVYSYFVRRGYVVARVDIRGTGNSEGRLIPYEYSDIENDDGEVVIDWLSRQPFSLGAVGMFGISWGGFNSIHLAMRSPPALEAIVAIDATDDLYQDDVHFMDGVLHLDSWEMAQDLDNAMPGAPDFVIDEAYFRDRFDTEPWMLTYKKQQRDGAFWDRTALKANYGALRIPSFLIGGWYDGYRDSIPRMLEHVEAPVKAMVGAWHHTFPNQPYPQPGMEWRREAVRWFDHWLLGRDTGIMEEPRLAVYVREAHGPGPYLEYAPGAWRWEEGWPIDRVENRDLFPTLDGDLADSPSTPGEHRLGYVPSIGIEAGGPVMWWGDVAPDQRPTDAFSLVYETAPLTEDVEVLGLPRALLRVAADAPHANWFARLNDVAPDGTVVQVTGAGFNGTHRESPRDPRPLVPGEAFDLDIEMHFTSWVFPAGHRIRLSISNAQWPMMWPSPYPMTTTLALGAGSGTRLNLPVVPRAARPAPEFGAIEEDPVYPGYESVDTGSTSGYGEIERVEQITSPPTTKVHASNTGAYRYPWGVHRYRERIVHTTHDDDPARTSMTGDHRMEVELDDGRVLRWESELAFESDAENFHYRYTRRLYRNGDLLRERTWTETIPRDYQ